MNRSAGARSLSRSATRSQGLPRTPPFPFLAQLIGLAAALFNTSNDAFGLIQLTGLGP
jgi:hypothetical protein